MCGKRNCVLCNEEFHFCGGEIRPSYDYAPLELYCDRETYCRFCFESVEVLRVKNHSTDINLSSSLKKKIVAISKERWNIVTRRS